MASSSPSASRLLLTIVLAAAAACATADGDRGSQRRAACCVDPNGADIPIQRINTKHGRHDNNGRNDDDNGGRDDNNDRHGRKLRDDHNGRDDEHDKEDSLVFAVIGDWGRTGGAKSVIPREQGGYDSGPSYWCSNPAHGFADDDYDGGVDQRLAGLAMDKACAVAGCDFIVSTGDNFYECGLDDPIRWKTDFSDIYQTDATPYIRNLQWYSIIGNHDIAIDGSVEAQIAYTFTDPRWKLNRTYAFEVHNSDSSLRLRFGAINTNPFVTKYAKSTNKYNTNEFRAYASPASITSQLNYLSGVLASSKATYDFVLGHHPVFGADSTNGYPVQAADTGNQDLGRPDANGNGAWQTLVSILRQYNPSMYMNGHDHTMALAADINADINNPGTLYLTSGAGSLPDGFCSVAAYRSYVLYDHLTGNNTAIALCGGVQNTGPNGNPTNPPDNHLVGFAIVTVTKRQYKIDISQTDSAGNPQTLYTITRPNTKTTVPSVAPGCKC